MITLKDQLLRHQLLLMRMVGTQAKATKQYFKKAEVIIAKAIKTSNFKNLQQNLEKELRLMPMQALKLVEELAKYESQFVSKSIDKRTSAPVTILRQAEIKEVVQQTLLNTSRFAPKQNIVNTYRQFADNKIKQYMQIVTDGQTKNTDKEELMALVKDRTDGLVSTQNLALAGLSLLATVGNIRLITAAQNDLEVEWSLDLELNNCADCVSMALNSPYMAAEVANEIPVHTNCGCSIIPILGDNSEFE